MKTFKLNINGKPEEVKVAEDTPLLWVLRDTLGFTGTKFGCGKGLCGACTVHLGDDAVRSCSVPISAVGEKSVTTIEGLANKDKLTPLQEIWCEQDVAQCGYCQGGQIMNAMALLNKAEKPSEEEIETAMTGNICRCATYSRIKKAILTAAK